MFIYLSKKIAIPNNIKLNHIAWNKEDGYIAVGGEGGLLKVLKLDSGGGDSSSGNDGNNKSRGLTAASNLSMNQTLEGHSDSIRVIMWNESHKKLTTSDENGVIIVWMLYKGAWYEEMINNRKKSTVVGMAWSSDGLKICIIYADGAVIVGSVDGNRIWGKELKNIQLSGVQWSPDGKLLLFSLRNGQVHLYDNQGNFAMKLEITCLEFPNVEVPVVGLDWYNGKYGYIHALCPTLAICYENGRMQLMCHENDTNPIVIDTNMIASHCSWNHNGALIAVAGRQVEDDRESNVVQFYSVFGDHLRTLKVPGMSIACCVWEGGSLRVALAVDSFVYFANIRPDYKWCYFKKIVVFTSCRLQKAGICVSFWDTTNNQCHTKYVPVLLAIAGYGDHCVLVTRSDTDETIGRYGLLLCNTLGTPVDGKYVDIECQWVVMNSSHVIAASKNNFLVWQYKTPKSSSMIGTRGKCCVYHIDDTPSGAVEVIQDLEQSIDLPVNTHPSADPICCLAASDKALIIGRESGMLQHYTLPHTALFNRYKLNSRPHKLAINCNSTKLSIINVQGMLSVIDINLNFGAIDTNKDNEREGGGGKLERRDVWAMCWASDNPQLLAIMEKTRMYVFKGNNPEEPISSSGYICSFSDLEIQAVLLDEVMETPEKPNKDHFIKLEVKSLRDTRQLLEKVGINEAAQFIEDNPHPRLWALLAEGALKQVNLSIAESAFIRSHDYAGILFVKKLQGINNEVIRKALVATYFKQFDEAEKLYFEADRRDLALTMRQTLGDWFRVIQIMKNGVSAPDLVLEVAYNSTAEYFAQFNNWQSAVEYYELAKNQSNMIECYYHLEDYDSLKNMIEKLPEGDPLLEKIGDMFASDAVYSTAVQTYLKLGDAKAALDLCVLHNKWDEAIDLAKKFQLPQVSQLFTKYTQHLIDQKLLTNAVDINVQAKYYLNAAELVYKLAEQYKTTKQNDYLSIKEIYVYAARLTELHQKTNQQSDVNVVDTILEGAWRGAEAYHYLLMCQQQIYSGQVHNAMLTAYKLIEYTNYINEEIIYSLLALTSCLNQYYGICSKAFIKLKSLNNNNNCKKEIQKLAIEIFINNEPIDGKEKKEPCFNCETYIEDWNVNCPSCNIKFATCVSTGKSLISNVAVWTCRTCHHSSIENMMTFKKSCPLCHAHILNLT